MAKKSTYKELEQKVKFLEKQLSVLANTAASLREKTMRSREAAQMAGLGYWELDLVSNRLYWSEEIYRMFDLDPKEFGATYEAFLETVHPEDRNHVDQAYQDSLKNKTGYDIVHRLLLKDGTIKHVHERCETEYDDDGDPVRSLGTVLDITGQKREEYGFAGIIGRNAAIKEMFETIKGVADYKIPVLVQGESGTGKELAARAIHNESVRSDKPFVAVNCGALPHGLLESEIFGHVKGAFSGAVKDRKGRFELARGGTIFLDEIAELPRDMQVKLLRVLQDGIFEPVGSEKSIKANVRVISATNKDLKKEVQKGNFRDDLFYRIGVIPIQIPPLRDRKDDIPLLVKFFLEQASLDGQPSDGFSKKALSAMINYDWPGNIRELQSAVWYALIMSKGKTIQPEHLPIELNNNKTRSFPNSDKEKPSRGPSKKLDKEVVKEALIKTGGNKSKASRRLGVGRATFYRFLKDFPEIEKSIE